MVLFSFFLYMLYFSWSSLVAGSPFCFWLQFRRYVWRMTVPLALALHKLRAGNGTTDERGTHRWVSGTHGCKIKIVMYLLVKVGWLWLRPCFLPSYYFTCLRNVSRHNVGRRSQAPVSTSASAQYDNTRGALLTQEWCTWTGRRISSTKNKKKK